MQNTSSFFLQKRSVWLGSSMPLWALGDVSDAMVAPSCARAPPEANRLLTYVSIQCMIKSSDGLWDGGTFDVCKMRWNLARSWLAW
jgi:hypothetical protein